VKPRPDQGERERQREHEHERDLLTNIKDSKENAENTAADL
jgi:hypothetical protein